MKYTELKDIHKRINARGYDEQELNYLFPVLYNNEKVVTRNERGLWKQLENRLKSGKLQIKHV